MHEVSGRVARNLPDSGTGRLRSRCQKPQEAANYFPVHGDFAAADERPQLLGGRASDMEQLGYLGQQ